MSTRLILYQQEPTPEEKAVKAVPPAYKLIASLDSAHGVHDVNTVVWCPREGMEGLFATAGDDGNVKVWKLTLS